MKLFIDWLQRKRHAKGFGVHSPFAFHFITDVVYGKHGYYAFFDIDKILQENRIDVQNHELHHLSYRLVSFFQPKNILEINSGNGVNTLYISYTDKMSQCTCVENDQKNKTVAKNLQHTLNREIRFVDKIDTSSKYDAIFIYLKDEYDADIETLFSVTHEKAFWLITGIKSKSGKVFWNHFISDKRARITFDAGNIGIVVFKESFHKLNYLI